jgi:hypothetical protein
LKTYFDASNKANSAEYDYLCLASVSGTEQLWTHFEAEWKAMLFHHCAPYLHTTDVLGHHGIYKRWRPQEVHDFLTDCVSVAKRHIALPVAPTSSGRFGLLPYVVSVSLKDLAAANGRPGVALNANEICIRQSLHSCLDWGRLQAACDEYVLYFDRGEPFYGYTRNLMESKKAKRDAFLLNSISSVTELDMKHTPAMQLSDLYAWSVSHFDDKAKADWHRDILYPYSGEHIDLKTMEQNAIDPEIWPSWNIPPRRPTN